MKKKHMWLLITNKSKSNNVFLMIKHTNSRVGINNTGNNNIKQQLVLGVKRSLDRVRVQVRNRCI